MVKESTDTLNYIARNAEGLAFSFLYDNYRYSGIYADRIEKYKDTDLSTEYNPLWVWDDPMNQDMLRILRGISDPRSLDYDVSYHTNNADSDASKQRQHAAHQRENDRILANLQKALKLVDSITSIDPFVKDEWYLRKDQDARTVTEIRTTHPYSGLPEPGDEPQEPQEPQEPEKNYPPELNDIGGQVSWRVVIR